MTSWLGEFVAKHAAIQRSADPAAAHVLSEARGMRLFGTVGGEVFLRPDGTTVALIEGARGESDWWEEQNEADHLAALVLSLKRFPELERLLPERPDTAPDCTRCSATGFIHGIVCATCSGLGWLRAPAT